MKFTHHGLQIELPDDWWTEAGMPGFVPVFKAYRVNHSLFQNVREVPLEDVGPVSRNAGIGIFDDSEEEGSARERVLRILRGFRFDSRLESTSPANDRCRLQRNTEWSRDLATDCHQ